MAQLTQAQGTDVSAWRADMPQIVFQAVDVSNIQNIPWENRGTWGQAVDFGVQAATAPVVSGSGGTPGTSTGGPWWAVLLLVVVAGLTVRRMYGRESPLHIFLQVFGAHLRSLRIGGGGTPA